MIPATPDWLRRYTKLTAFSTLFLVFAGAMVTSTASGLSVPDWPLSFGMVFPPMVGGIFYEHGHRMIAASVGFLTMVQAVWLQMREPKRVVRILGWTAVGAVVAQGLLGGLTVLFLLPPSISVAHAGLAEIFLSINVSIAFFTSRFYLRLSGDVAEGSLDLAGIGKLLVGAVYVQILIGAVMRHIGAGLAIPDFPLSFGHLVPDFTSTAIAVNFAHRTWGVLLGLVIYAMGPWILRRADRRVGRIYAFLIVLVTLQISLGAVTVWSSKQPVITSFHVVTGALTFATTVVFALSAHVVRARARERGMVIAGGEAIA